VSVRDITPDAVLAAVQAGHDDVFKLADHFEVMHVSHTLRGTIAHLEEGKRLVPTDANAGLLHRRWKVA